MKISFGFTFVIKNQHQNSSKLNFRECFKICENYWLRISCIKTWIFWSFRNKFKNTITIITYKKEDYLKIKIFTSKSLACSWTFSIVDEPTTNGMNFLFSTTCFIGIVGGWLIELFIFLVYMRFSIKWLLFSLSLSHSNIILDVKCFFLI